MRTTGKLIFVIAGLAVLLTGCGGGTGALPPNPSHPATPTVSSIAVSSRSSSLPVGLTQQFMATATLSDGSQQDVSASVTWTSSAANIASINSSGLATAVAQGAATIEAVLNSVSGTFNLKVTPAIAMSIAVSPQDPTIPLGTSQQFAATATMSDGSRQDVTSSVIWSSSAANIATIDNKGFASSKTQGSSTISASLNSMDSSTGLSVGPAALASISVKPANGSLAQGTKKQFSATGAYTDGGTQDLTASVKWSSSNSQVATIDAGGVCTAKNQGLSTIVAVLDSVNGATGVKVTPASLVSIVINPPNSLLPLGLSAQLTASGIFTDNSTQDITSSVTWSSSDVAKVSISAGGLAQALKPGGVTISAALNSVLGSTSLTASAAVLTGIRINPVAISLAAGTKLQLSATGLFSDGSTSLLQTSINWSSSAQANATIDSSGLLSALVAGKTHITAADGAISGSVSATVTPAILSSLVVTPSVSSIGVGANLQFTATGIFSDDTVEDLTDAVHWATSDANLCLISNIAESAGLANALAPGNVSITATSGEISGSAGITVNQAKLVSINLGSTNISLALGTKLNLKAIGDFDDGSSQDITANVTWSSSSPGVSVDDDGVVAALTANTTADVSASLDGISGSVKVSVPLALVSISISSNGLALALGTSLPLTAIGHFNDGTTQDLTASVTWSSDDAGAILVNPAGLATALALGSANVNAQLGSVSGSIPLTATSAILDSIDVTPANGLLSLLSPVLQFHATGHFSDGSTQDVTSQVQWSSGNSLLVVISNLLGKNGLATRVSLGTVTVSAQLNGVTGSTSLQSIL